MTWIYILVYHDYYYNQYILHIIDSLNTVLYNLYIVLIIFIYKYKHAVIDKMRMLSLCYVIRWSQRLKSRSRQPLVSTLLRMIMSTLHLMCGMSLLIIRLRMTYSSWMWLLVINFDKFRDLCKNHLTPTPFLSTPSILLPNTHNRSHPHPPTKRKKKKRITFQGKKWSSVMVSME